MRSVLTAGAQNQCYGKSRGQTRFPDTIPAGAVMMLLFAGVSVTGLMLSLDAFWGVA